MGLGQEDGIVFGGMLRGIRKTAEAMHRAANPPPDAAPPAVRATPGYGRARLWLGMSAVGSLVVLAVIALALGLPAALAPAAEASPEQHLLGLAGFALLYALVQLPFDLFGGYLLPRRYGRSHPPPGRYLAGLARGVAAHTGVLLGSAAALMLAGKYGGVGGTVATGAVLTLALLRGRVMIASVVAPLELTPSAPECTSSGDRVPVAMAASADEGFTGAVVGVFRPRLHLLPVKWREVLGVEGLQLAVRATRLPSSCSNRSWRRGRVLALLFTLVGLTAAALLVGPDRLGTAAGTMELSLWFTLWSFVGLLTLPTLSRRGVDEVDERLLAEGCAREAVEANTRLLDDLQDGERDRPALVENIFHLVPSVEHRLRGPHALGRRGYWNAARTSVYLSLAGLGLLGRAVHCNCGRPSLWVFLPVD